MIDREAALMVLNRLCVIVYEENNIDQDIKGIISNVFEKSIIVTFSDGRLMPISLTDIKFIKEAR